MAGKKIPRDSLSNNSILSKILKIGLFFLVGSALAGRKEVTNGESLSVVRPNFFPTETCFSSSAIFSGLNLNLQCPISYDNEQSDPSILPVPQLNDADNFLLNKIELEEKFAKQLTTEQQLQQKHQILNLLKNLVNDPGKKTRMDKLLNGKGFKIVIVDSFAEQPNGAGVYVERQNTLFIRSPDTLPCNDTFAAIIGHEAHHAYITNLRCHGDPIACKVNNGAANPFTNKKGRTKLKTAISRGDEYVTVTFHDLHEKAKLGKLIPDSDEQKEYANLVQILQEYEPRCAAEFFSARMKRPVPNKGESVKIGLQGNILFVTNVTEIEGEGKLAWGKLVEKPDMEKVEAFILDTQYRMANFPEMYGKIMARQSGENPDDLITCESDAEINANPSSIIKAFYLDVAKYHEKFRSKIEHAQDKKSQEQPKRSFSP